jgi:pimeloyl-ACP methyl ester carboxylesterase
MAFVCSFINTSWGTTAIKSNFALDHKSKRLVAPKPLVLLLHGFTASMATWDNIIQELEAGGAIENEKYDVLMMDFYGSGDSCFLPLSVEYSTASFEQQVNEVLAAIYLGTSYSNQDANDPKAVRKPDFSCLCSEEREMIPDMLVVGHSQGGIFSATYASNPLYTWVKSVLLVTPGGISFQYRDIYHTPWHIIPRTLYTAGT